MPTPAEINQLKNKVHTNGTKSAQNRRLLWLAGGTTVVLLIIASVLTVLTPRRVQVVETPLVIQNMDATRTRLTSINFTGVESDFPQTLFIARPITSSIPEADFINSLILRFNLVRVTPESEFWSGDNVELSRDKYTGMFTLVTLPFADQENLPIVSQPQAVEEARQFITQILPNIQLHPLIDSVEYLDFEQEAAPTTPDKANAIRVAFAPEIADIPVFYQKEIRYPFSVLIDSKNQIRRLLFLPQFDSYETIQETPRISIEQAIKNILAGQAAIIDATYIDDTVALNDLVSAELTTVRLEYRQDDLQNLVYPFYRFTGQATTQAGTAVSIELITPAISVVQNR
jgi:hypothetical protein